MAVVKLQKITKRFGNVVAVNDVSLTINDKEFIVLLGPSGCGKTTLLRCVAGLEIQDEGDIYIDDVLVNDLPPKKRDVSMVFQSYAVYPHMTVYENLAFPLKMRKYPKQEIHSRVKKVAELLNIAHLLNRKPSQLSGGEMQRVAVGRAIIREPKVFLMDEPLSNLDAKLRVYMRVELKKLQKEVGVTTIYVTHDQAEAMTMGDRIAVMNKGEIQQVNTPENVYFKPANVFVASFIGSPAANLIACTLAETEGKNYLDAGIFKINISEEASKLIKNNAISPELVIGVRPEDISILREKHSVNAIQAEVYAMEPLGKEVIVDLKVGDDLLKSISSYLECSDLKIGDKVWLMFDETKIHIFDKKTGKIIY